MYKKLALAITLITVSYVAYAQTAGDVLENGKRVKTDERIFLQFKKGNPLSYDVGKSLSDPGSPPDFRSLPDSSIFLPSNESVNIFLTPLNPLNYSHKQEIQQIEDPINAAARTGMTSIFDVLTRAQPFQTTGAPAGGAAPLPDTCQNFMKIEKLLKAIQLETTSDQKEEINKIFNAMKAMNFDNEKTTGSEMDAVAKKMAPIQKHFEDIDALVKQVSALISSYDCGTVGSFLTKNVMANILTDSRATVDQQKKRFANLQQANNQLIKAQTEASAGGGPGLPWCVKLDQVDAPDRKISVYTVTIKESGYKLSENGEIVAFEGNIVSKRVLRIRRYQQFVPEISTGIVYTFFTYNTYGTTTNSSGQQVIADPTKNAVDNINVSVMINWNLYTPNSLVHPLFQTGAGVNGGIPSFLIGGGLRFGSKATNRIRVGVGYALTWIKELDSLKVGSEVTGTDQIEKDLKYKFQSPRPYVGIQYNF